VKHLESNKCPCKPKTAFDFGDRYGKVYVHAMPNGQYDYPPVHSVLRAVNYALKGKEVHIIMDGEQE